ncbi:MAG: metal transporter substrate-binding protein [Solirubrobacterales bacterium]|nr:metal transporter substrate-binding protein [Solirubrobacterales bacterium]
MNTDQGSPGDVEVGQVLAQGGGTQVAHVSVRGEHDLNTAPGLRNRLEELIDSGTPILIDLSPASFVDSSILGVILDCRRRAQEAGVGFSVASADGTGAVERVLEITGLRAELPVHDEIETAAEEAATTEGTTA